MRMRPGYSSSVSISRSWLGSEMARIYWAILFCLGITNPLWAQNPRGGASDLEKLWDKMMVNGEFGVVQDGSPASFRAIVTFEAADGWVNQVLRTKQYIGVSRKDGEAVRGGLVRRVEISPSVVAELYAKQLPWGLSSKDYNRFVVFGGWGAAHEFFLLVRSPSSGKATVLKQWQFPFNGPGRFFMRGFLDYDAKTRETSIRIFDGLDRVMVNEVVAIASE